MLWALALYFVVVLVAVPGLLVVSLFLGERHRQRTTVQPYESGIMTTGAMPVRFPASYYLVAMLFVVFDLESVFLFAWAVAAREVGWKGYATVAVFVVPLFVLIAYLWRNRAIDWRTARQLRDLRSIGKR